MLYTFVYGLIICFSKTRIQCTVSICENKMLNPNNEYKHITDGTQKIKMYTIVMNNDINYLKRVKAFWSNSLNNNNLFIKITVSH